MKNNIEQQKVNPYHIHFKIEIYYPELSITKEYNGEFKETFKDTKSLFNYLDSLENTEMFEHRIHKWLRRNYNEDIINNDYLASTRIIIIPKYIRYAV